MTNFSNYRAIFNHYCSLQIQMSLINKSARWWLFSFHPYPQGLAGFAAYSLGSCFLNYLCGCDGSTRDHKARVPSCKFGAVCPLHQHLLTFQLGLWEGMGLFEWLNILGNFL